MNRFSSNGMNEAKFRRMDRLAAKRAGVEDGAEG